MSNTTKSTKNGTLKIFDILRVFIFRFSVMLSLCSLTLALIDTLALKSKISGEKFLYLSLLSFLVAIAMLITDVLKNKKVNDVITYGINFLLCYLSFGLIFYLMRNDIAANSFNTPVFSFLLLTCVFVILYTAIAIVRMIGGAVKRKILSSTDSYKKLYSEDK